MYKESLTMSMELQMKLVKITTMLMGVKIMLILKLTVLLESLMMLISYNFTHFHFACK